MGPFSFYCYPVASHPQQVVKDSMRSLKARQSVLSAFAKSSEMLHCGSTPADCPR